MRFSSKLSLLGLLLLFPPILSSTTTLPGCHTVAWAAEVRSYGSTGMDGKDGQSGQDGGISEGATIFADGSPLTLDLTGRNGENGENGTEGSNANCGSQPVDVRYNVQAPSGGNGGNGGSGGNGGNGGNLTAYTTNISNLRQILVNASGGQGGLGGQGGAAGQGCQCETPYWTVQTCQGRQGDANYRCTTEEFQCFQGRNGVSGTSGRQGSEGTLGQLTLINSDRPLEPDQPSATVTLSILKNNGFLLSKDQWETRQGATALFASGSAIADQYRVLTQRRERAFILIWNAPQSFEKFANQTMTLTLEDDDDVQVVPPQVMWVEGTTQQRSNRTEFVVYNAMFADEAVQLEASELMGRRKNIKVNITDKADLSDIIQTKFLVKYKTTRYDPRFRPISEYSTRFDDEMPSELVTLNGNQFTLDIGQLPIEDEYFGSDLGVEIEIIAVRSFAGYSAEKRMVIRDRLSSFPNN